MLLGLLRFAPILFLVNSLYIGFVSPGYSGRESNISSLVHEKFGWWQTANFLVCGLLTLGLALYLRGSQNAGLVNAKLVLASTVVFGVSLVLLGIFPTDKPGQGTLPGYIHGTIFITSVVFQIVLQIIVALSNMPALRGWYVLLSGIVTALGLLGMLLVPGEKGIAQRILVGAITLWVATASFWIRK